MVGTWGESGVIGSGISVQVNTVNSDHFWRSADSLTLA